MSHTLEDGLRALREAAELAASIRIDLDDRYRRAIALSEALPENQSGADKTWVLKLRETSAARYAKAVPIK